MIHDPQVGPLPVTRPAPSAGMNPSPGDLPLKDVLVELWQNIEKLFRQEVALARAEIETKAKKLEVRLAGSAAGAVLALCSVFSLVATVILLLAQVMPAWLSALITSGATGGVGYLLLKRSTPSASDVTPERTIRSLEKDLQTIREAGK